MKNLILSLLLLISTAAVADDIFCPQTIACKGKACGPVPKTFTVLSYSPQMKRHPDMPIPGKYQFIGAQTPALCNYKMGNLPYRSPRVTIRSPLYVPDTSVQGTDWTGALCLTDDASQCPFTTPGHK